MAGNLITQTINSHNVPLGSADLIAADSTQVCKAWVNFNGVPLAGTYVQSGTLVTVTMTAHGMETGMVANLDFTSGTAVDTPNAVITSTGANTFTFVAGTSLSTSGNVTRNNYIRNSFNVSSITDNGVGDYTVNFTTAMPDSNYNALAYFYNGSAGDAFCINGLSATSSSYRFGAKTTIPASIDTANTSVAIFR